ncbi:hypothetical protein CC1G_10753 [Coprinopsis cinerea okayama7|uniref:SnoaL-like domain-containing protein n=1 Tax=Coprinopsis cinerea (strain Okayama-7 / 130 / ATCC MYA-4618 / FGSC 9003) TaxID=240176 RepID=A8P3B1_COPC7|nr:hypothetical protein CC1G_10753 [Coprinopsis cinerea okayama7\|eukprot:XP_001838511.1 hypothetical protein CC1G_10753 [Coprinopsis cinerea okayama7\
MLLRTLSAIAIALLSGLLLATPARTQNSTGSQALGDWFINDFYPSARDNVLAPFEDGTFSRDIVSKSNDITYSYRKMKKGWIEFGEYMKTLDEWTFTPVSTVAYATDDLGLEGSIIASGEISVRTKNGTVFTGGKNAVYVWVKYNRRLGRRVIKEWREVYQAPPGSLDHLQ